MAGIMPQVRNVKTPRAKPVASSMAENTDLGAKPETPHRKGVGSSSKRRAWYLPSYQSSNPISEFVLGRRACASAGIDGIISIHIVLEAVHDVDCVTMQMTL